MILSLMIELAVTASISKATEDQPGYCPVPLFFQIKTLCDLWVQQCLPRKTDIKHTPLT